MKTIKEMINHELIDVIKAGTQVELKNGISGQIQHVVIHPDNTLMYEIHKYTENGRVFLGSVFPSDIKNHDKLISGCVRIHDVSLADSLTSNELGNDALSAIIRSFGNAIVNNGLVYGPIPDNTSIEELFDNAKLRYEMVIAGSHGYIDYNPIRANDNYIKVYDNDIDANGRCTDYITRDLKLKPFYRRWLTTLIFGINHPNNYSYIESDEDYINRIRDIITKSINERGYILFNKSSVRL